MTAETQAQGRRVLQRTRSACPPLIGTAPLPRHGGQPDQACVLFNQAVLAEILALRSQGEIGVVIAGRWTTYTNPLLINGTASTHELTPLPRGKTGTDPGQLLAEQLRSTLNTLHAGRVRTLVIGAIPELRGPAPECLARRSVQQCAVSADAERRFRSNTQNALEAAVENTPAQRLWDPLPHVCPDGECLPSRGGTVAYRDSNHLTTSFVTSLRPALAPALAWLAP
jgi:hypothetical protein